MFSTKPKTGRRQRVDIKKPCACSDSRGRRYGFGERSRRKKGRTERKERRRWISTVRRLLPRSRTS